MIGMQNKRRTCCERVLLIFGPLRMVISNILEGLCCIMSN